MAQSNHSAIPDPEVNHKPTRRKFDDSYKIKILDEVDQAKEHGQIGAILRREGLYYSHLKIWRQQKENGELKPAKGKSQRLKRQTKDQQALQKKIHALQNENGKLRKKLEQAHAIIDVQKKISNLMGLVKSETNDSSTS